MKVSVVGLGKAGGALLASLRLARVPVVQAVRRAAAITHRCDVLFLAVPDDALSDADAQLSARAHAASLVVHLSGVRGSEALPLCARSVLVGTFHPLASLDGVHPIPDGTLIAVDATTRAAVTQLNRIASRIHAVPAHVPSSTRPLYHAGAVVSANLAVALLAEGVALLQRAGVPEELARVSLARLLRSQADNAVLRPLPEALTGPVARGDAGTVALHVRALGRRASDRALLDLYRALSLTLVGRVAVHPPAVQKRLRAALTGGGGDQKSTGSARRQRRRSSR